MLLGKGRGRGATIKLSTPAPKPFNLPSLQSEHGQLDAKPQRTAPSSSQVWGREVSEQPSENRGVWGPKDTSTSLVMSAELPKPTPQVESKPSAPGATKPASFLPSPGGVNWADMNDEDLEQTYTAPLPTPTHPKQSSSQAPGNDSRGVQAQTSTTVRTNVWNSQPSSSTASPDTNASTGSAHHQPSPSPPAPQQLQRTQAARHTDPPVNKPRDRDTSTSDGDALHRQSDEGERLRMEALQRAVQRQEQQELEDQERRQRARLKLLALEEAERARGERREAEATEAARRKDDEERPRTILRRADLATPQSADNHQLSTAAAADAVDPKTISAPLAKDPASTQTDSLSSNSNAHSSAGAPDSKTTKSVNGAVASVGSAQPSVAEERNAWRRRDVVQPTTTTTATAPSQPQSQQSQSPSQSEAVLPHIFSSQSPPTTSHDGDESKTDAAPLRPKPLLATPNPKKPLLPTPSTPPILPLHLATAAYYTHGVMASLQQQHQQHTAHNHRSLPSQGRGSRKGDDQTPAETVLNTNADPTTNTNTTNSSNNNNGRRGQAGKGRSKVSDGKDAPEGEAVVVKAKAPKRRGRDVDEQKREPGDASKAAGVRGARSTNSSGSNKDETPHGRPRGNNARKANNNSTTNNTNQTRTGTAISSSKEIPDDLTAGSETEGGFIPVLSKKLLKKQRREQALREQSKSQLPPPPTVAAVSTPTEPPKSQTKPGAGEETKAPTPQTSQPAPKRKEVALDPRPPLLTGREQQPPSDVGKEPSEDSGKGSKASGVTSVVDDKAWFGQTATTPLINDHDSPLKSVLGVWGATSSNVPDETAPRRGESEQRGILATPAASAPKVIQPPTKSGSGSRPSHGLTHNANTNMNMSININASNAGADVDSALGTSDSKGVQDAEETPKQQPPTLQQPVITPGGVVSLPESSLQQHAPSPSPSHAQTTQHTHHNSKLSSSSSEFVPLGQSHFSPAQPPPPHHHHHHQQQYYSHRRPQHAVSVMAPWDPLTTFPIHRNFPDAASPQPAVTTSVLHTPSPSTNRGPGGLQNYPRDPYSPFPNAPVNARASPTAAGAGGYFAFGYQMFMGFSGQPAGFSPLVPTRLDSDPHPPPHPLVNTRSRDNHPPPLLSHTDAPLNLPIHPLTSPLPMMGASGGGPVSMQPFGPNAPSHHRSPHTYVPHHGSGRPGVGSHGMIGGVPAGRSPYNGFVSGRDSEFLPEHGGSLRPLQDRPVYVAAHGYQNSWSNFPQQLGPSQQLHPHAHQHQPQQPGYASESLYPQSYEPGRGLNRGRPRSKVRGGRDRRDQQGSSIGVP